MDGCGIEWGIVCDPKEPDSRPRSRAVKGQWHVGKVFRRMYVYIPAILALCKFHLPQLDSTFWQPRLQWCRPCCILPTASAFAVYYRADCTSRWRPNRAHTVNENGGMEMGMGMGKGGISQVAKNTYTLIRRCSINIHKHGRICRFRLMANAMY